jgi:hypothetical protein
VEFLARREKTLESMVVFRDFDESAKAPEG